MKIVADLLGAFLPGLVWVLLILSAGRLSSGNGFPPALTLADVLNSGNGAVHAALLLGGLLCGLSLKGLAMKVAEPLSRPDAILKWLRSGRGKPLNDYLFPLNSLHGTRPYFRALISELRHRLGADIADLPAFQPFSACKRLVKAQEPALGEELDAADSEARMLGSLFIAAVLSAAEAAVARTPQWMAISLAGAAVFGYAFRVRRTREVAYCYLSFLIAARRQTGERSEGSARYNRV